MDEAEMVEAGRKMAALEHSKMCHQATVQIHYVGHDTLPKDLSSYLISLFLICLPV